MEKQILFITICTKGKNPNGNIGYLSKTSITNKLSGKTRNDLFDTRRIIQSQLGTIKFDGIIVDEENQSLEYTEDFGGNQSSTARYLPAYERYDGRFYNDQTGLRVIGDDGKNGFDRIFEKKYHLLILSGLYGIVDAHELIQNYSCPIDNRSINLLEIWQRNDIIAKAIIEYIQYQKNNHFIEISRIIDLTGMKIYRDMVSWDTIYAKTGVEVLHLYNKKIAGDKAIELFGRFFREYLLSLPTEKLLSYPVDTDIIFDTKEIFRLSSSLTPPKGWASETVNVERETPQLAKILYSYQEAYKDLEEAIGFLHMGENEKMKNAVDSGSKKLGAAFENSLKILLPKAPPGNLGDYIRAFKKQFPISPLDDARFNFYREIRNNAAHDYHTRLLDFCGFIQFFRQFLINYLKFSPNSLNDPIDFLKLSNNLR